MPVETINRSRHLTKKDEVGTHIWNTITTLRSKGNLKLPGEMELCQELKASRSTIRKVTDGLVERGVLRRIQGKGTFIQGSESKVFSTGKIPIIGIVYEMMDLSEYLAIIIRSLTRAAHEKGFETIVCPLPEFEVGNSYISVSKGPGEVVGYISSKFNTQQIKALENAGIPCVALVMQKEARFAVVGRGQFVEAFRYLVKLGHTRICYMEAHLDSLHWELINSARDVLKNDGVIFDLTIKEGHYDINKTIEELDPVLSLPDEKRPTAILCHDDYVAAWVMNYIRNRGFSVPRDFSVMGIGNLKISSSTEPKITSVAMDYDQLASSAIELFEMQLGKKKIENPIREVSYRVVERESCRSI